LSSLEVLSLAEFSLLLLADNSASICCATTLSSSPQFIGFAIFLAVEAEKALLRKLKS